MATPERDTVYTNEGTNRTVYTRESNATGWFVGIIVALALAAIAYLVFAANNAPRTEVDINGTPAVTAPATEPATTPAPMTEAPAVEAPATETMTAPAPMTEAPAVEAPAPATPAPAPTTEAPATNG